MVARLTPLVAALLLAGCGDPMREQCPDPVFLSGLEVCGKSSRLPPETLVKARDHVSACLGVPFPPSRVFIKRGPIIRDGRSYDGWADFATLDITINEYRASYRLATHEFVHIGLVLLLAPGNSNHENEAFTSCVADS